ncbi:MAG TPA: carboxypeptidase-like regulatory domain-containing protein [Longimicrobium sp.]
MKVPVVPGTTLRVCAAALLLCAPAGPAGAQAIVGRVIDAQSGTAVSGARVSVTGGGQREPRQTATDAEGRYSITLAAGGTFRVQAARTGYEAARTPAVRVGPQGTATVDVRLQPAAVRLREVKATARRRRLGVRGKFVEVGGPEMAALHPVSAAGEPRSIRAQGSFVAPSSCFQLAGVADRTGSVVTLNVGARPNGQVCTAGPATFKYNVSVRGLPPGSYTFRIAHTVRGVEWPATMPLDTTIVVP